MPLSAITRKQMIAWGGPEVYAQAERLAKRGAVLQAELCGDSVSGVIAREGASEIRTRFRLLANGLIESQCPCPTHVRSGLVCPHVVALGITLMLRKTDPQREAKYREDLRRARRIAQIPPENYLQRGADGLPARIVLTLSPDWVSEFRNAEVGVRLQLDLPSGLTDPAAVPRGSKLALPAADDILLTVIEDIVGGPPPERFTVDAADFLNLLDVASQAILRTAGSETLTVEQIPMKTLLKVDLDPDSGDLIVYPFAELPFLQTGSLPVFLVYGRRGRILANGHLWPMENVLPIPYHSIYCRDEVITRDRVLTFLHRDLPALEAHTPVMMEVPPDLFVTEPGEPVFRLTLQGSQASLRATLSACYGPHTLPAGSPETQGELALPDPADILKYRTRNSAAEAAACRLLTAYGFEGPPPEYTLVGTRPVLNFLGTGYRSLGRAGWKITFTGKLSSLIDTLPVITPVVRINETASGWFDVGFDFDRQNGPLLPPAEIQRALNRGDAFLEHHGTTLLIDREAVDAMRAVFEDCPSRESPVPGHFLLPPVYAPFVHASLNALDGIDVEDPPDWRDRASARNRDAHTRLTPIPLGMLENTLRPYQKEGVYWLRFLEEAGFNGILADEMGLGKTVQTLAWLSLQRSDAETRGKPALIVCPTSLVENWNREAKTFVPHLRRVILSGPDRATLFPRVAEYDLAITSYALLRRDLEAYRALRFAVVVLDEAQHIKNRSTQNAVAAKQIHAVGKLVLTGTPVENSVADLWSIMDFLMPGYLGEYEGFRLGYELPIAAGGREGELAQAKLRRKLHPFLLRRLKRDVAHDLPDKIVRVSYCRLTSDQQKVYSDLLAVSRRSIGDLVRTKGFDRSRMEILAMLMRLRQACCHLDLLKDHHPPGSYAAPSSKFEAFFELLDEAMDGGHRILVFSQFVTLLKLLRAELDQRGIPCCYLDGATQDRLAQCQRFNLTPSIPVFLISLKAGGTGLNLTGADMVIHLDPWWNPAVEDQATDRAHRIGQKRTVYSIKLIAEHTVEEKVLALQRKKQAVIQATLGTTDAALMRTLSFEDIRDLVGLT